MVAKKSTKEAVMCKCLECGAELTKQARGQAPRFCSVEHKRDFHNRAQTRGVHIYHLFRAMRRERAKAKQLNLWTELCRLELAWEDEDRANGRTMPSYKPAEMTLQDIAELKRCTPTTNLFIKERMPA